MAFSLPNNLVFVPLDVLTAEELNQLMANDNYIAKQFPLSPQNLDWSTMSVVAEPTTVTKLVINTATTIQSLTVPVGKWKISGRFNGYSVSEGVYQGLITLVKDGTVFSRQEVSGSSSTDSGSLKLPVAASPLGVIEATTPSTIELRAIIYAHSLGVVYKEGCWLVAERIG